MDVLRQCIQTRAYERRQGIKTFVWSSSMEIKMSKGLVNLTFAYPSILTVSIYDGCLLIAAVMVCSVGQQRPGKEAKHFLDCAWATWVCGARTGRSFMWRFWLSPTLSFFLSLFIFLFFYISPFFSPLFFFKQARADTFLKEGYSFGWLELETWRYAISPTLGLFCESQVCNVGVSFWVYFHSKEHQSVQLMQSLCSQALYVTWND